MASLVAALVSAFCYGIASVMQAVAIRSASRRPARIREGDPAAARVDPGLIVRLLGQWRFVASIGIDFIGFLAQLVALQRLPLFAVQAVIASNLAPSRPGLVTNVLHLRTRSEPESKANPVPARPGSIPRISPFAAAPGMCPSFYTCAETRSRTWVGMSKLA